MIQSTRAGLGRRHLAFAVANCLLNWRFATAIVGSCSICWKLRHLLEAAPSVGSCCICWKLQRLLEAAASAGSCGICWKLRWVAGKARNMAENALYILIVLFSLQLQQTEISDRKLFIFKHGIGKCAGGSFPAD